VTGMRTEGVRTTGGGNVRTTVEVGVTAGSVGFGGTVGV